MKYWFKNVADNIYIYPKSAPRNLILQTRTSDCNSASRLFMFIVYINLQILASIFYSLFHIFYLLLVYCTYFIFSILLLEALITEEPSGEHKFSGGWLLFLFIFSHIHIKDYYNLLLKRIQQIRDHLFLT